MENRPLSKVEKALIDRRERCKIDIRGQQQQITHFNNTVKELCEIIVELEQEVNEINQVLSKLGVFVPE